MRMLELFCGTKSIGKEFEKLGFEVVSIDLESRFAPTICADIRDLDPKDFTGFDVVWASPPCNAFSVCRIGRNWNHDHTPKNDIAREGMEILQKTVEFIEVVSPQMFWIENPVGKMRRMPQVQKFTRQTVTYCRYGDTRQKPTDIWTNTNWQPRPQCAQGAPCHESAPRGSKTGTQGLKNAEIRAMIPQEFCQEIAEYAWNVLQGNEIKGQQALFL